MADPIDSTASTEPPVTPAAAAEPTVAAEPPKVAQNEAGARKGPWQWRASETPEQRVARVLVAPNPLLEAAQPLLRALAEMPQHLPGSQQADVDEGDGNAGSGSAMALRDLLGQEIQRFQQVCERANIRREHGIAASYLLCTALDEAAHNRPWGLSGWPQHGLLVSLHQDTAGGSKSFQLLGRLLTEADEHLDLLEVFYQVLSLGFVGRYAGVPDGHRQIDAVRQRLLTLVTAKRGEVPRELSPHWKGEATRPPSVFRTVPIWLTVSVLGVAAIGLLGWYKYHLLLLTRDAEQQILAIGKLKPTEPAATLRLKERLKDDIARGTVSVLEDGKRSVVTFRGDDMFAGGRSDVRTAISPVLDKVAAEIAKVPGKVMVVGHTDSTPIKTAKFPSNQVLSEERAATVSEYLASKGVVASRLESVGKGDTAPLASNTNAAGRARNRRVEIIVTQP